MASETPAQMKVELTKNFLLIPNSKKKKWAEDIIRYSPEELSTKMAGCTNIVEAAKIVTHHATQMILAYNFLGKEKPEWLNTYDLSSRSRRL